MAKLHSQPLEALQLEHFTWARLPFWNAESDEPLLIEIEDQTVSEKILRKMIDEKKTKQNLQDDLESLA